MGEFENLTSENLLKASDIARILNISKALSYRLLQKGEIPSIRINHAVRVIPDDLEKFIKKHRNIHTDLSQ